MTLLALKWKTKFKSLRSRVTVLVAGCLLVVTGCRTVGYYNQAIKGQLQIITSQEPIATVIADPASPRELKERLKLVNELRLFASQRLGLEADKHYLTYADLKRPFVVWNVGAAGEFSMESKTWWYPFVGSLKYRGYFDEQTAREYAGYLKREGYDAAVGGVSAYSTLGWFRDPVLNTFLFDPEAELAETLFHELAHQRVFASGDTDFNEAFATAVGQEGTRRWLASNGTAKSAATYDAQLTQNAEFARLIGEARLQLEQLFGDTRTKDGTVKGSKRKSKLAVEELRAEKERIFRRMRAKYAELEAEWGTEGYHHGWFERPMNNARLNAVASYYALVPGFEKLLELNGGDLETFYGEVERLSKKSKQERHAWLRGLAKSSASM